ncbi:MAG: hypothetical protein VSS75_006200 [Candidatus Parabeggiatoa sp.]|nr:hypothetical protein [Candidatus Parabeggiatoa sp.]
MSPKMAVEPEAIQQWRGHNMMKPNGEVTHTTPAYVLLTLISLLTWQSFEVTYAYDSNSPFYVNNIVHSPPTLPNVPTEEDVEESVESVEQQIKEWTIIVSDISSRFVNYLKAITKLDASCRVNEIFNKNIAENKNESSFRDLFQKSVRDCKKNVARHKERARILYAKGIAVLARFSSFECLIWQSIEVSHAYGSHSPDFITNIPIVPSLPTLPDVPTEEEVDESIESIERQMDEWKKFVTQASCFDTVVDEMSSGFANYLKSLTKLDSICKLKAKVTLAQSDSVFAAMYQSAVIDCKRNLSRHKALGRIYVTDLNHLTKLAAETTEAIIFFYENILLALKDT